MDSLGGTVTPSVDTLIMDRTVSLCVTVMSQTVIMSTVVQSLQQVRYIIIIYDWHNLRLVHII